MKRGTFILLLLSFQFNSFAQYTKIDESISIRFEGKHSSANDLLNTLNNKSIIWLEKIILGKEDCLFGLSKYVNNQKAPINLVFEKYVRNVTPPNTIVLEAGHYKKGGTTYYYKISQSTFSDKVKRTNVMYYLMPYNFSDKLYEFKITSDKYNKLETMNYLEKMVSSAKLK